ncbi:MAG: septum formation inhibitor Maf [Sulfurovum sp.]|nr:septum formation inhibitor Maf [Sulfurovum sp.]MCB4745137.1 septum formation inhibitor Maf [Sulfurovum sp.]MCB4746244.1 septum formation inhibitor Maf [Sulfurovum sp.]MCB4749244.1 septum formation inhibitor Maf [Sulfurovum sp.]MCB4749979.1 septum formation inhibitor Maf [Sulfurovum sp.]
MIVLCSQSESRALLLQEAGIDFIQKPTDFDENQIKTTVAKDFVYAASKGKLEMAERLYGLDVPLLTADSIIATQSGEILRKPKNSEDARRVLLKQSAASISIISSVHYKTKTMLFINISAAHYCFASFDKDDLEAYIQSGEWQGKAGGCMVEGFCKKYITETNGHESTARGLQVEVLKPWLNFGKSISNNAKENYVRKRT